MTEPTFYFHKSGTGAQPQAASTPKSAVKEPAIELISDMRHFIKATSALFEVLPAERKTEHLPGIAAGLVKRADEVLGHTEQGSADE